MATTKGLIKFLGSLWGLLAVAAVLFPGAAALLSLDLAVENSKLAKWYSVVGTIASAFTLLFLSTFKERMRYYDGARRIAMRWLAVAVLGFFAYVGVRTMLLDVHSTVENVRPADNKIIVTGKAAGLVLRKEHQYTDASPRPNLSNFERGDPWDLACLAGFLAMMCGLTGAFGALGMHVYFADGIAAKD